MMLVQPVLAMSPASVKVGASAAPRSPLVTIDRLTKRFPIRRPLQSFFRSTGARRHADALRDFSCDIARGEFFGLLGPNGAGKSTLFRMLATLVVPNSGTATIAGLDLQRDANRVRSIVGFVNTDERSLNWRLSARDNLRFYAALHRLWGHSMRTRVEEVLASVELTETGDQMVGQFSSGMRQRLLIARTLIPRPQVILLDEPTRSLDPIAARRFRRFLREELVEQGGCTVLLATHNSEEAMTLCDRVGILDRGRLLALGGVRDLSRDLLGNRVHVRTRTPHHPAFARLVDSRMIADISSFEEFDGWSAVTFTVSGHDDRCAKVIATLVEAGVVVAEFRRVEPLLADVIEKLVQRGGVDGDA